MKISKKIKKFNNVAYSTNWEINNYGKRRIKKIIEFVGKNKKVLDVGCYDGTIASALQNEGNSVVGLDISLNAVKLAKQKGIEAYQGNLEEAKIPKKLKNFDSIVAGERIEHIFDTDSFLNTLKKLLKKEGTLIITTPNLAGIGSRISLLIGKKPWMIENSIKGVKAGHIRYFTIQELTQLLENNGLKVDRVRTDFVGLGKRISIPYFDKLFPSFGRILIVRAVKL